MRKYSPYHSPMSIMGLTSVHRTVVSKICDTFLCLAVDIFSPISDYLDKKILQGVI